MIPTPIAPPAGARRGAARVLPAAAALLALLCLLPLEAGAQRARKTRPAAAKTPAPTMIPVKGVIQGTDIVRTAREYLGVRYVLGGTTPKAFDCSGFIKYVYARYDIPMPRTAREQAGVGIAPFPGDLRPGDLLFFYGGQGAQHIALYVGGDTIIHASSTGKRVKLDVMKSKGRGRSWFRNRLIAVRRVLPAQGTFYLPAYSGGTPAVAFVPPSEAPPSFRLAPTVF
jgi:peptidoglycan DL-endopeptidase CwlO